MDFIIKNSYSPTVREICNGVGINSTSWVKYHMGIMREQGVISFVDNKARTITVIKRPVVVVDNVGVNVELELANLHTTQPDCSNGD